MRRMPTVQRIGPYRLFFFSEDRAEPPHVHVKRDEREGKFWLLPVSVARSGDFRPNELRTIIRIVRENSRILLEAWYEYFKSRS